MLIGLNSNESVLNSHESAFAHYRSVSCYLIGLLHRLSLSTSKSEIHEHRSTRLVSQISKFVAPAGFRGTIVPTLQGAREQRE